MVPGGLPRGRDARAERCSTPQAAIDGQGQAEVGAAEEDATSGKAPRHVLLKLFSSWFEAWHQAEEPAGGGEGCHGGGANGASEAAGDAL